MNSVNGNKAGKDGNERVNDARGIETSNLYYALKESTLRFGKTRGVSNVLTAKQAAVSLESGLLLVVHTAVQEVTL